VKLTFLGTRGEIDIRSRKHRMHTSLLISYCRTRVLIDCGLDWLGRLPKPQPHAILITHAHPDHAGGLKSGASCPVFATPESWKIIAAESIPNRVVIFARQPFEIGSLRFEAFPLEHSLRAPAVGFRITCGSASVFYSPDVVSIHELHDAFRGIQHYIGDGAAITRPILRQSDHVWVGHASIRMQLEWCRTEGVPSAIFTHCGKEIVGGDQRQIHKKIAALAKEFGVPTSLALDGLVIDVSVK